MQAFSDNGIYVFLDLDTFNTQIEESNPEWTYSQYTAFTAVIDAFASYDNIAGFFVANEVLYLPPISVPITRFHLIPCSFCSLFLLSWCRDLTLGGDETEWNGGQSLG